MAIQSVSKKKTTILLNSLVNGDFILLLVFFFSNLPLQEEINADHHLKKAQIFVIII